MAVRLSALRADRVFPPLENSWYFSVRGYVNPRAIVRLEGCQLKKNASRLTHKYLGQFRLLIFTLSLSISLDFLLSVDNYQDKGTGI
jgi:hypothetical protein